MILLSNVLRVFRIAWDVNIEKILYELMSRNVDCEVLLIMV